MLARSKRISRTTKSTLRGRCRCTSNRERPRCWIVLGRRMLQWNRRMGVYNNALNGVKVVWYLENVCIYAYCESTMRFENGQFPLELSKTYFLLTVVLCSLLVRLNESKASSFSDHQIGTRKRSCACNEKGEGSSYDPALFLSCCNLPETCPRKQKQYGCAMA